MSTEYRHAHIDQWVCTRWACRRILDAGGMAFDFGSPDRLDALMLGGDFPVASESGHVTTLFAIVGGDECMGREFRPTFVEFCGTVALGSGELLDRLGLA